MRRSTTRRTSSSSPRRCSIAIGEHCHFDDAPCLSLLKHLTKGTGGRHQNKDRTLADGQVLMTFFVFYFSLAVWTYGIMVPSGLFVPGIISP